MVNLNVWIILGIISILLLVIYFLRSGRNAVWGGLTLGISISLIIFIVSFFKGTGLNWYFIVKGAIVGTIVGFIAELLGMLGKLLKKHNK